MPSDNSDFAEGFKDGIGEWGSDGAIGSEVDLDEPAREIDISDTEAAEDDRSLRVWNQGDYDDGVTWVSHPVSIEPGQGYQIKATDKPGASPNRSPRSATP